MTMPNDVRARTVLLARAVAYSPDHARVNLSQRQVRDLAYALLQSEVDLATLGERIREMEAAQLDSGHRRD